MSLHTQEVITTFEQRYTEDVFQRLKEQLINDHPDGLMPRDAHPKMHGLVSAEFTVHADLDQSLQIGVFAQPVTYQAWVRFSNASTTVQPDAKRDIRGMAIKLLNVPGDKLSNEPGCETDQDFLLINANAFLCPDIQTFDGMVRAIQGSVWNKLCFFVTHPGVLVRIIRSFKTYASPLTIRYFSSTPYLLSQHPVKYCVTPAQTSVPALPATPGPNYLRQAMRNQLQTGYAEFVFGVQRQSNPRSMPVENATARWDEAVSPYLAVATLRIAKQDFDNAQRDRQGEDMRFSPWNCLPVHRPLGSINRARRLVYHGISELRRRVNGVQ